MTAATDLVEAIEAVLPQTQCGQCGFEGCTPYARALASGEAGCDRCPPGGDATAAALARLLGLPVRGYDRSRGQHLPPQVAVIREPECIGCTKCIQACPIDAIIGAAERMHSILADACSGCALCVPVCPVDCIELRPIPVAPVDDGADPIEAARMQRSPHSDAWRRRHDARTLRLDSRARARLEQLAAQSALAAQPGMRLPPAVTAAIARAAARAGAPGADLPE